MKLRNIISTIAIASTSLSSSHVFANDPALSGEYKAVFGYVKTMEISNPLLGETPEQLGKYSVWLVNSDWNSLTTEQKLQTQYIVKLTGTLRGLVNPVNFSATHTMVGSNRDYIIRSENDQLYPLSGDPLCETGEPMKVQEKVNLVSGTGTYSNLVSGTILFKGTVNNCPTSEDFGKNDLYVIPHQGSVVFE